MKEGQQTNRATSDRTRGMPLSAWPAPQWRASLILGRSLSHHQQPAMHPISLMHPPTLSPRWSCPQMRVVPDVNTLSPRDSASSILRCRPRRATFRLPLWGLTLRRSRWALERRQRGEPSSPPARQKERGCDTALPPAPSRQQPPPLAVYVLSGLTSCASAAVRLLSG